MAKLGLVLAVVPFVLAQSDGTSGTIELRDYNDDENRRWEVNSDCTYVQITSTLFDLEDGYDFVIIDDNEFTGSNQIDLIVYSNFVVTFTSDYSVTQDGFSLNWECTSATPPPEPDLSYDRIQANITCLPRNQFSTGRRGFITDGVTAVRNSWPWIASMQSRSGRHMCGGSLITAEWVVTAAHCCIGEDPSDLRIVVGEHDLSLHEGTEFTSNVVSIHPHPNYNTGGFGNNNDVCLLRIQSVDLQSNGIGLTCLPAQGQHLNDADADDADNTPKTHCYVAGWGSDGSGSPNKLQSARVNMFSASYCADNTHFTTTPWADGSFDPDAEFCAGFMGGGRDTCYGDSGGPLVCVEEVCVGQDCGNQPILYGITSWGFGCGDVGSPGLYSKVSPHINWFNDVINNELPTLPTESPTLPGSTLTGTNGTIVHLEYTNNEDISWTIQSDCDMLYIYSDVFNTEANYDFLYIGDYRFHGASEEIHEIVQSSSVTLRFTSDSSVTRDGFVLQWRCTDGDEGVPTRPPPRDDTLDYIPPGTQCSSGNIFTTREELNKVFYGVEALPNSWPWIVSLRSSDDDSHFCGGSVVNSRFILTAAHCCEGFSASDITVVLGEHDFTDTSGNEVRVRVQRIHMHHNYVGDSSDSLANDVCLLKTDNFELDGVFVQPVCLPEQGEHVGPDDAENYPNNLCFTAGWGDTDYGSPIKLQSGRMNIFSSDHCEENTIMYEGDYGDYAFQPEFEFCAGHMTDRQPGGCYGDSGGPLVCLVDGQPILYGVVSWGIQCDGADHPTVYAKVASQISWMQSVIVDYPDIDPDVDTLTGTEGVISHLAYDNDEDISWTITSDCDQIYVYSEQFDIENQYDFLYIDGVQFTGFDDIQLISRGSTVDVQFISDYSVTSTGFILHWRCTDGNENIPTRPPPRDETLDLFPSGMRCQNGNPFVLSRDEKVFYGVDAHPHSHPWIASLRDSTDFHFCGGSVVANQWVLTAAHCCEDGTQPEDIFVVLGEHDLSADEGHEVRLEVQEIHMHPNYVGDVHANLANDVCLLKTNRIIFDGDTVDPICLPELGAHIGPDDAEDHPINQCYIAGWGDTETGSPTKLQSGRVNIFSPEFCSENTIMDASEQSTYDYYSFHPEYEFCAGFMSDNSPDSCYGDSGGPLVCIVDGEPVQYGVVSWGLGCGGENTPAMFATVAAQIEWMRDTISECDEGFIFTEDGCQDINECDKADPCGAFSTCFNTPGSFECHCFPGYDKVNKLDNFCVDRDECSLEHPFGYPVNVCGANSVCVNTEGSFECDCAAGFAANNENNSEDNNEDSCIAEALLDPCNSDLCLSCIPTTTTTLTPQTVRPIVPQTDYDLSQCPPKGTLVSWKGARIAQVAWTASDSVVIRIRVPNNDPAVNVNDSPYIGFLGFAKRRCGLDLVDAFVDGRIEWDLLDRGTFYRPQYAYKRQDGRHTAAMLQFFRHTVHGNSMGTSRRDQVYLSLKGLNSVTFPEGIDVAACFRSIQGGAKALDNDVGSDANHSGCAAWDKDLGW